MSRPGAAAVVGRAVALAVAAALLLGACGSSGADQASQKVGIDAGATGGGTTSTAVEGTATSSTCKLLQKALLEPAGLPAADSQAPEGGASPAEELDRLRSVADLAPADQADAWRHLIELVEQSIDDPGALSDEDAAVAIDTIEAGVVWAQERCPDSPPSWRCESKAKFQTVGSAIDQDGAPLDSEGGEATPEDVLATYEGSGDAVELDRTTDAVLYGWLDGDGLVVRSEEVDRVDGSWTKGASLSCSDDVGGSGGFETVGNSISSD